ncbi:hypothetical protein [Ureibacillus manganicus]|uniref:hypothetical protein n=1 Tax=Ureibacillus manganicus TaxID=1266064 RepID=UPI001B803D6F|nr:hypothetical protein [Ureibacillus manganicus]
MRIINNILCGNPHKKDISSGQHEGRQDVGHAVNATEANRMLVMSPMPQDVAFSGINSVLNDKSPFWLLFGSKPLPQEVALLGFDH